ncbi:MAG: carbohydrate binding family 9 domain-containing protein, partial [Planctomycetota bacterium]
MAAPPDDAPALPPPESHPQVEIVRTETPPTIDGVLDEPMWGQAAVIDNLTQVEPLEGVAPTRQTEIRILFDDQLIYFGVRCFDPEPDRIVARQLGRDGSLDSDDRVELVIDPIFDRRSGFFFATNPVSARLDGLVVNNRQIDIEWDGIWYAKSSIDDQGWVAEFAIPFQTISFNPKTTRWGFNLERVVRRDREVSRWSGPSRNLEIQSVANAGVLEGIRDITQGLGLDVKPYAKGTYEHGPTSDDFSVTGGADLFYKLTPAITLTLTFNTDFAETEVDERQVNLTRFPLFFPEKRDFFLQDAGIFRFGGIRRNPLPYQSRRIGLDENGLPVRILAGAKVTGRQSGWNLGFLTTYMDNTPTVDHKLLSVARVSRDVLDESAVGFIAT